jgi:hypothetical protein
MTKYYLYFLVFLNISIISAKELKSNFYGETSISKEKSTYFSTNLNGEYNLQLYEPKHKKWILYLSGKVSTDYDHINNEIKTNVFTTFGIDF